MISAEADAAELDLPSGFDWRNGRKQLGCRQRMKNFFTSMLGALVALVIFSAGCLFLFIGLIGALAAMGGGTDEKKAPSLEAGAYVVFDLSANITDAPPPFDLSAFNGGKNETLQLRTVTRARALSWIPFLATPSRVRPGKASTEKCTGWPVRMLVTCVSTMAKLRSSTRFRSRAQESLRKK